MDNHDELKALLERSVALPEMGYWDYEWEEFASYYDPLTRMFYWAEGSGCSCYGLWDEFNSVGDLGVGRKDELLSAAKVFADGRYNEQFEELRKALREL